MSWANTGERADAKIRTKIREKFGAPNNVPVIEADVICPMLIGESGGFFTKGGTRISHPSAYAKKGFSNMCYICSTYVIKVPKRFLVKPE